MFNNIRKIFKNFKPSLISIPLFAFDLGSSQIRINISERGTIRIPTIITYHVHKKEYLFYGKEAKNLIGKLPKEIEIINPIKKGVIQDFDALLSLLNFVFEEEIFKSWKELKFKLPLSQAITSVPYFSTEIEQRASFELLKKIGFNKVFLVFNLVAAGYGLFEEFSEISPRIIVDLGAGKTEAGVVSRGGIVLCKKTEVAGDYLDAKIRNYLYIKYGLVIGFNTAEKIKIDLLNFEGENKEKVIKGKSLETGLPKQIRVNSNEIRESLLPYFYQLIDLIKSLIEEAPPEILEEVVNNGIYLTGGLAKIPGIQKLFFEELKVKTYVLESKENSLIKGLTKIIRNPAALSLTSIS